jgi:hypothetical protein
LSVNVSSKNFSFNSALNPFHFNPHVVINHLKAASPIS